MRHWIESLFGNAVNNLWGVAAGIILARSLVPELRGEVGQILFWSQVSVWLVSFSIHEKILLSNFSSQSYALSIRLFPAVAFLLTVILFSTSSLVTTRFDGLYVFYGMAYLLINYTRMVLHTVLYASEKYSSIIASNSMYGFFYLVGIISCLALFDVFSVSQAMLATIFGECISLCYIARTAAQTNPIKSFAEPLSWRSVDWMELLKIHAGFVVGFLAKNVDKLIVFTIYSSEIIGLYLVAGAIPNMAIQLFSRANYDVLYSKSAKGQMDYSGLVRLVLIGAVFNLIGLCVFVFFGETLVEIIFGENYIESATLLMPLLIYSFAYAMKDMTVKFLKPRSLLYSMAIEALIISVAVGIAFYAYLNGGISLEILVYMLSFCTFSAFILGMLISVRSRV
jgi:hypothetical protein